MLSFEKLREANENRQIEWDGQNKLSLLYMSNALAGEVGELCNVVKKIERQQLGLAGSKANWPDLEEEIADVLIYLDLLAMGQGINLSECVKAKFNKTSKKLGFRTMLD